jgi:hypothetical protein
VPRLVERFDMTKLDAQLLEKATAQALLALKKQHDLEKLVEKLADEASKKARDAAREGLDKVIDRIGERLLKDAVTATLPKVQERLDMDKTIAAVRQQVVNDAAAKLVAEADLGPLTGDLKGLGDRVAREAMDKLEEALEVRLAKVDPDTIEARIEAATARAKEAAREARDAIPSVDVIVEKVLHTLRTATREKKAEEAKKDPVFSDEAPPTADEMGPG